MPTMSKTRFVSVWLRMCAQKEIRFARDSNKLLQGEATKAGLSFEQEGEAASLGEIDATFDNWVRILIANYSVIIRDFAAFVQYTLKPKAEKVFFQDYAQSFIKRNALNAATEITKSTKSKIKKYILKGQKEGASYKEIASSITSNLKTIAPGRAQTIAITEVHNAAGFASFAQAKDMPELKLEKTWVSTFDERTRQDHVDLNNVTIPMDDFFNVGGDEMQYPGDTRGSAAQVINCRCVLVYTPRQIYTEI